jgi:predicted acyl esterase
MLLALGCIAVTATVFPASATEPAWWEGWSLDDPRLSQPIYTESVFEAIPIVADDGVVLDAKVLRPVVPPGTRLPTIMHLSPYLPMDMQPASILPEEQQHSYVQRGYALVGVSVRGFGASGGCPDYQGARDRADTDTILDAIAAQPWSNGKIGAVGLSWDGTTLNAAATSGNPHLTTIVPAAGVIDWYKWSFMQGVPAWYQGYSYNIYAPPVVWAALSGGVPPQYATERVCPALAESMVVQGESGLTGLRNEWWDERDLNHLVDGINPNLAVLQVQGARDDGVRVDQLHTWDAALRQRLPNYRLLFGDWVHLWPDTPNIQGPLNPEFEFNKYPLTSWPVLLLRWFDHWLKGSETGIMAMPRALIQDDRGNWHGEDGLEPSRAATASLFPTADGRLAASPPASGSVSFVDYGENVNPSSSCVYLAIGIKVGCAPVRQPTAQYFVSEPYETTTRFSGIAKVHVELEHTMPRGTIGVTLYVVNGQVWSPMTYGIASFAVRNGDYEYELVEPGVAFEQTVEVLARDFVLPAGHRLGLAIGAQVGRWPKGVSGNGYAPIPSGGVTDVLLGASTWVELDVLEGPTQILPLP